MKKIQTENYNKPKHWNIEDKIINLKTGETKVLHHENLVVDSCSKLLASLVKGDQTGVAYWAVGSGDNNWSNKESELPKPQVTDTKLKDEIFRKKIMPEDITFIDEHGEVTENITNTIQIKVDFKSNEANGDLREFALFGGKEATEKKDSGIMLNRKIHVHIGKTSGVELHRAIRIKF